MAKRRSFFARIPLERQYEFLEQYGAPWSERTAAQEDNYSSSIGRFFMAFSMVETALDHMIISAINDRTDEEGYRIIKYLRVKDKIHLAKSEYRRRISFITRAKVRVTLSKKLKGISSKLEEISEFRNRLAHANWESLTPQGFVRVKVLEEESGQGIRFERIKITPAIIQKFIRQAVSLASSLDGFAERVNAEMFRK